MFLNTTYQNRKMILVFICCQKLLFNVLLKNEQEVRTKRNSRVAAHAFSASDFRYTAFPTNQELYNRLNKRGWVVGRGTGLCDFLFCNPSNGYLQGLKLSSTVHTKLKQLGR